ncbi:hypothetical protein [Pseudoprimorskyibacter insulae]|uniref:hypothetical protein n=1 Tax=Pseudoprimorskyibacter insulae TaxID=1695997 RepID=UPI0011B24813|nr:hypothetical protein [Pseudoprimorskyibacter insulae]
MFLAVLSSDPIAYLATLSANAGHRLTAEIAQTNASDRSKLPTANPNDTKAKIAAATTAIKVVSLVKPFM